MNIETAKVHAPSSTPAERMRRHRERRRLGIRNVRIQLQVNEIDALVRKGYLQPDLRDDPEEVRLAAETFFGDALNFWP